MHCNTQAFVSTLLLASTTLTAPTEPITRLDTFQKRDLASSLAPQLSPGAEIVFPDAGEDWIENTDRWTKYLAPTFQVAIQPTTEADVAAIITYANQNKIQFFAQGGRHGYAPELATIQNAIMINLQKLNTISVNNDTGVATVGGGTIYQDVYTELYAAGREMTVGSCPCVGVLGAGIGGGHGRLQGLHGLSVDSMLSLRLTLANATSLTVSTTENADLFWGMRGAGHNFGIVTSADFRTYPQVEKGEMYDVEMLFDGEKVEEVFGLMNQQIDDQPGELAVNMIFGTDNTTLKPTFAINFVYAGPQDAGRKYSQSWIDLAPLSYNESMYTWAEFPNKTGNGIIALQCLTYGFKNTYSVSMKKFDIPTIKQVWDTWGEFVQTPAYADYNVSTLLFEVYGQSAIKNVAPETTAYANRGYENILAVITSWYTDPSIASPVDTFSSDLRDTLGANSGNDELHVYQNYAHSEPVEAIYGYEPWRVERLQGLKQVYDPMNKFGGYHPIPPAAS